MRVPMTSGNDLELEASVPNVANEDAAGRQHVIGASRTYFSRAEASNENDIG